MSTNTQRRRLIGRRWGWPTIGRQAPAFLAWCCVAAEVGVLLDLRGPSRPWWPDALAALPLTLGLYILWKLSQFAAFRWRHTHRGLLHELPGALGDALLLAGMGYVLSAAAAMSAADRGWVTVAAVGLGALFAAVIVAARWRRARGYLQRSRDRAAKE